MDTLTSVLSSVHVLGERDDQQDHYCEQPVRMNGIDGFLLAVFDGHGPTDDAARYCRTHFVSYFQPKDVHDISAALSRAIARLADEIKHFPSGTTLSAAFVCNTNNTVSVAVIGDSPVIVHTKVGGVWLAPQHNVRTNIKERSACIKRGALYSCGYIETPDSHCALQLSRALGDAALRAVISDVPDMHTISSPIAVMVASDGIGIKSGNQKMLAALAELVCTANHVSTILEWRKGHGELHDNTTILLWRA